MPSFRHALRASWGTCTYSARPLAQPSESELREGSREGMKRRLHGCKSHPTEYGEWKIEKMQDVRRRTKDQKDRNSAPVGFVDFL